MRKECGVLARHLCFELAACQLIVFQDYCSRTMGCIGSKEVQEGLPGTKKVQNQPSQNGTKAASTAQQQKQKQVEPVDSQKSYITDDASAGSGLGPGQKPLDKNFGFSKNIALKYDIEEEIGRGHFGHTCAGRIRKGDNKGQRVAIKIIPKGKVWSTVRTFFVQRLAWKPFYVFWMIRQSAINISK